MEISTILDQLYTARQAEEQARAQRVELEVKLAEAIGLAEDWEGTKTSDMNGYKVRLTRRINYRIDSDKLRETARAYNMAPKLNTLFRWRPELNRSEWAKEDGKIKSIFARAMVGTPGKPTFNLEKIEEVL